MSSQHPTKTTGLVVRRFSPDEVFGLLRVPFRRKLIGALAMGGMKTGDELNAASGRSSSSYRQQLTELCKVGVLVKKENPQHGRKPLYSLSPDIAVCHTNDSISVDLGGCILRFRK